MVRTYGLNELVLLEDSIGNLLEQTLVAANSELAHSVLSRAVDRTPVWVPNIYPPVPDRKDAKKTLGGETKASWRVFFGQPEFVHVADGEQPDPGGTMTKLLARNKLARAVKLTDLWVTNGRQHIQVLEFGLYPSLGRTRRNNPRLSIRGRLIKTNGGIFSTQAPKGIGREAVAWSKANSFGSVVAAAAERLARGIA